MLARGSSWRRGLAVDRALQDRRLNLTATGENSGGWIAGRRMRGNVAGGRASEEEKGRGRRRKTRSGERRPL